MGPMSQTAQGKQRAQEGVPQFDEAAFERAFEMAQQDAMQEQDHLEQPSIAPVPFGKWQVTLASFPASRTCPANRTISSR
jgi:hypothetical protein